MSINNQSSQDLRNVRIFITDHKFSVEKIPKAEGASVTFENIKVESSVFIEFIDLSGHEIRKDCDSYVNKDVNGEIDIMIKDDNVICVDNVELR